MTPAAAARASVAAARSSASSAQPLLRCPAAGAAHHARRRARAAASAPALALASWTRGWAQLRAYSTNNDDAAAPRAGYSAGASPGDSSSTGTSTSEERTPLTPLIEEVIRVCHTFDLSTMFCAHQRRFASPTDCWPIVRREVHAALCDTPSARLLRPQARLWQARRLYHEPRNLTGLRRGALSCACSSAWLG